MLCRLNRFPAPPEAPGPRDPRNLRVLEKAPGCLGWPGGLWIYGTSLTVQVPAEAWGRRDARAERQPVLPAHRRVRARADRPTAGKPGVLAALTWNERGGER